MGPIQLGAIRARTGSPGGAAGRGAAARVGPVSRVAVCRAARGGPVRSGNSTTARAPWCGPTAGCRKVSRAPARPGPEIPARRTGRVQRSRYSPRRHRRRAWRLHRPFAPRHRPWPTGPVRKRASAGRSAGWPDRRFRTAVRTRRGASGPFGTSGRGRGRSRWRRRRRVRWPRGCGARRCRRNLSRPARTGRECARFRCLAARWPRTRRRRQRPEREGPCPGSTPDQGPTGAGFAARRGRSDGGRSGGGPGGSLYVRRWAAGPGARSPGYRSAPESASE